MNLLLLGVLLSLVCPFWKHDFVQVGLWLSSMVLVVTAFRRHRQTSPLLSDFGPPDLFVASVLLLIFIPLYTGLVYYLPYPVNSDEISIMFSERYFPGLMPINLLGLSTYFGFPSFIFIVLGWLGRALGGVTLEHMRLISAFFGLAIVLGSYLLFRVFWGWKESWAASTVLGFNHALVVISRMAVRDNTALLADLAALAALFSGLERGSSLLTLAGGMLCGLTFYTYYPSRVTLFLWLIVLAGRYLFERPRPEARALGKLAGAGLLGFWLCAGPVLVATVQAGDEAARFMRAASLLHSEGRDLQRQWLGSKTIQQAFRQNVVNGLSAFNTKRPDYSWIYPNLIGRHGFVDPLTGVLLWIGILGIWLRRGEREDGSWGRAMSLCFLFLWLLLSFVVNKAPNYTRLLVTLPFVAYLSVAGIKTLIRLLPLSASSSLSDFALFVLVVSVSLWNVGILKAVFENGLKHGQDIGGTGRYIETHKSMPYTFYLAADGVYPYYSWNFPDGWKTWMSFFAVPGQDVEVIVPGQLAQMPSAGPFTVFMNRQAWARYKEGFLKAHPKSAIHDITPGGDLLAAEVD